MTDQPMACYWGPRHARFDFDAVRAWLCELSLSTYYAKEPPTLPTRDPRVEKGPTHTHARATRQE